MQIEPNNGRVERVEEGNWKKKKNTGSLDNFQGHYSHCGQKWNEKSIRHTLTHHSNSSHSSQAVREPKNRLSLDLVLSSLLWTIMWRTCTCVWSQLTDRLQSLLRKHTSPRHKSPATDDPELQPSVLIGAKAEHFHWQKYWLNKRLRYGSIWGLRKAEALCPYSPSWIVTQSYLHQERATCEQQTWSIAGLYPECL